VGISRWLNRIWNLVLAEAGGTSLMDEEKELRRMTHKTIKRVNEDLERFHFNTMLAALMEFSNYLAGVKERIAADGSPAWREAIDSLLLLLAPALPYLAEELWERTGHAYSIHHQPFPTWQEELVAEEQFTLVIQVNGKVRDKVSAPVSISEDEAKELSLNRERIKSQLGDRRIVKVIYVAGRLVNIVVK
ncbi:class I tRNA ligase family protein, partial [Dehalococcoidia bacterium]|nr:class I tRNA ligase family protein [Dehalococcoidia bacterium]